MGPLGLSLVGQRSLRWRVEIKKHRGSDLGGLSAHLNREGPEQWRSGPSLFPVPKGVTFSETSTEFSLGKTVTCIRNRHTFGCGSHVWVRVTRLGAGHTFGRIGQAAPHQLHQPNRLHRTLRRTRQSCCQVCHNFAYSPPRATSSSWVPSSARSPSIMTATRSASCAV